MKTKTVYVVQRKWSLGGQAWHDYDANRSCLVKKHKTLELARTQLLECLEIPKDPHNHDCTFRIIKRTEEVIE